MNTERVIDFDRMEELTHVLGSLDQNISIIERELGVRVVFRDGGVKVVGEEEDCDIAARTIENLLMLASKGEQIDATRVNYVLRMVREGEADKLRSIAGGVICITVKGKPIKAKTVGQQKYIDEIRKNTIVLGIGPAGTGKTYLAVALAVAAFRDRKVDRIIITRPAIEAGEKLGFLRVICRARWTPI